MCNWSHQAQWRDTTFIMGHALLKKAILHLKTAIVRIFFCPSVCQKWLYVCSWPILGPFLKSNIVLIWSIPKVVIELNWFSNTYKLLTESIWKKWFIRLPKNGCQKIIKSLFFLQTILLQSPKPALCWVY